MSYTPPGELREMRPCHEKEFVFLFRKLRHDERTVGVKRAHQDIHTIFLNQLGGGFERGLGE